MNTQSSPKSIVQRFYAEVIGARHTELARELIAPDYIQHNPQVKTGLNGVLEAIAFLQQFPTPLPPAESPIKHLIEDGPLVGVHMLVDFAGTKQVVMDIFRVENGQLVEHWDAIQPLITPTVSGTDMVGNPSVMEDLEQTEPNKARIRSLFESSWIPRKADQIQAFFDMNFIQHHPEIAAGQEGMKAWLDSGTMQIQQLHRVIGEGNLVLAQSSGMKAGQAFVSYDLFRLQAGMIVEMWNVSQAIPDQMAHENGMI
ncbi:MAG: nuclear transport factor 2 family protein [Bacteroidota bacterium]